MRTIHLLAAFISLSAGAVLPLQAMLNAKLGRSLGSPSWAGVVSAAVSALILLAVSLASAGAPSFTQSARQLHPAVWLGGLLGALYLFAAIYCIRTLGAAGTVACMLLGQLVGALVLDWSGLSGTPMQITWERVIGCSLAAMGVVLLARSA